MIRETVHMLYWTAPDGGYMGSQEFTDLAKMLEEVRLLRSKGARFVTTATEVVGSVSNGGVAPNIDYSWWKRRRDPSLPLGRDTRKKEDV